MMPFLHDRVIILIIKAAIEERAIAAIINITYVKGV
jgi:hypothetical protein